MCCPVCDDKQKNCSWTKRDSSASSDEASNVEWFSCVTRYPKHLFAARSQDFSIQPGTLGKEIQPVELCTGTDNVVEARVGPRRCCLCSAIQQLTTVFNMPFSRKHWRMRARVPLQLQHKQFCTGLLQSRCCAAPADHPVPLPESSESQPVTVSQLMDRASEGIEVSQRPKLRSGMHA